MKKGIYIETPHKGILKVSDGPMTVLQVHRALQEWADDDITQENDKLDIIDLNPSSRFTDYIIRILKPYKLTKNSFKFITKGMIIQGDNEVYYDKVSKGDILDDHTRLMEYYKKKPQSV